jgi:hypothetical protein
MILGIANKHALSTTIGDLWNGLGLHFDGTSLPPCAQVSREFGVLPAKACVSSFDLTVDGHHL